MKKLVIIINGKGSAGKDTLCGFAESKYKTMNISAITPIKDIAKENGWRGEKDPRSRKFLSDLKKTFIDYNDLPCRYLKEKYDDFLESNSQLLFVHIREAEEIDKFKNIVGPYCKTLLIRRDGLENWGNASDDEVENYSYDYIYENNTSLSEAESSFTTFLEKIFQEVEMENKKTNE